MPVKHRLLQDDTVLTRGRLPCQYGSAGPALTGILAPPSWAAILLLIRTSSTACCRTGGSHIVPAYYIGHSGTYFHSQPCTFLLLDHSLGLHNMRKICDNAHSTCTETDRKVLCSIRSTVGGSLSFPSTGLIEQYRPCVFCDVFIAQVEVVMT